MPPAQAKPHKKPPARSAPKQFPCGGSVLFWGWPGCRPDLRQTGMWFWRRGCGGRAAIGRPGGCGLGAGQSRRRAPAARRMSLTASPPMTRPQAAVQRHWSRHTAAGLVRGGGAVPVRVGQRGSGGSVEKTTLRPRMPRLRHWARTMRANGSTLVCSISATRKVGGVQLVGRPHAGEHRHPAARHRSISSSLAGNGVDCSPARSRIGPGQRRRQCRGRRTAAAA